MLILQAFFLWLIVSALIIGGAMIFHRRFPQESPWFGFVIPPVAFVILLNFIEHLVALPSLLLLLPIFLCGTVWLIVAKGWFRQPLYLPTFVFLAAFAFTFGVRCLQPNIDYTSDGISDLNMVNNFSQGEVLPPPDTWMPPSRAEWYYGLQHYGASIVGRLLDVKIGVAYNLSFALLSALICVAGAAAAWRITAGSTWITLAVPFVIESAMTGSTMYLALTSHDPGVWLASDLSGGMTDPPDDNPLWKWLAMDPRAAVNGVTPPTTLRLQVPGFWTWRSEYHANASGHLLTLMAIWTIAELVHLRRTLWPWVLAALIPLLAVVASAWALPITALLCWGIVPLALFHGRRPAAPGATLLVLFIALTLLWPAFYNASSSPEVPPIGAILPSERVPALEFLLQWWPIIALWICACCRLRDVSFGLRWVMFVVPVMLLIIENVTIDTRYNMIEKMWGYTWGAALIGLFPVVAARAGLAYRAVTFALLCSALTSMYGFSKSAIRWSPVAGAFHLEGTNYLTDNDQMRKMLEVLRPIKHATFLSGKCAFCYTEAPALAVFTGNKSYIAWAYFESLTNYKDEAEYREKLNNDFYSGAMTNRLKFLQDNRIAGVLIWPDDNLADDYLDTLRKELEPSYEYIDCKGNGDKNAGVFLLRPLPSS